MPPTKAPERFMVATVAGPGERMQLLDCSNYHHDRPDDAPVALTTDPRRSPVFSDRVGADRAVRRFSAVRFMAVPERSAMLDPSAVVGLLDGARLPGDYAHPLDKLGPFGVFVAEYDWSS